MFHDFLESESVAEETKKPTDGQRILRGWLGLQLARCITSEGGRFVTLLAHNSTALRGLLSESIVSNDDGRSRSRG